MGEVALDWKKKFSREMRLFFFYSIYFTLFFWALTTYRMMLMGDANNGYFPYGYGIVQSFILAKIILIGKWLGLGERYLNGPLILSTLNKTFVFCLLVIAFSILEHVIFGFFNGNDFHQIFAELISKDITQILGKILLIFLVFILFFAFVETGRVMGEEKLYRLFFRRKKNEEIN